MTDPIYGDNPIDPVEGWNETFRPPLVQDPEWVVWRAVFTGLVAEHLESAWLTRWRRSVLTAEGAQLAEHGAELGYPQPVGWTEDRYRAVLVALLPASFAQPTTEVVGDLAEALLDVGQSFTFTEEWPCSARFTFLETDADDATAYASALDRARPRGCQYFLVAHPGGGLSPFILGTSTLDGPDTLSDLFLVPLP